MRRHGVLPTIHVRSVRPTYMRLARLTAFFFRCRHAYQGERNFHILYQLVAGAADAGVDLKVICFILVSVDTASAAK